jgi:hypothetical protein
MNTCFKNIFAGKITSPASRQTMPLTLPQKGIDFYETTKTEQDDTFE